MLNFSFSANSQIFPFKIYNSANGLIHNRSHIIRQDGLGYMWVGTDMGICSFDGREFKHYPCPSQKYVSTRNAIQFNNKVYFTVDGFGIAICKGDSVQFIEAKIDDRGSFCGIVCLSDSEFLFNNLTTGLCKMTNKGNIIPIRLPAPIVNENSLTDIVKDIDNNLWICSSEGLIFVRNSNFQKAKYVPFFKGLYVNNVKFDKNGNTYIGYKKGAYYYTRQMLDSIFDSKPLKINMPIAEISCFAFLDNEGVWLSSTENGLFFVDKKNSRVQNFGVSNGLLSNNIWDVFCDKEKNIWVCTEIGLNKIPLQNFVQYDFRNESYQSVKSACIWDDTSIFISNLKSIFHFKNTKIEKVDGYKNIVAYLGDLMLKTPDNKLIVEINDTNFNSIQWNVSSFIYSYDFKKLRLEKPTSKSINGPERVFVNHSSAIFRDEIWLHTNKGLQVYKNGKFSLPIPILIKNEEVNIKYLARNKQGDLWVLDKGNSFHRFQVDSIAHIVKYIETVSDASIASLRFNKIFVDSKNNIWLLSSESGLAFLKTKVDGSISTIKKFQLSAFSSGVISDIAEDIEHNIWVATAQGLDKVSQINNGFKIYKDQYASELCGKFIFFVRSLGNQLFVGTTGCAAVITLGNQKIITPPEIYITGVKVNNKIQHLSNVSDARFRPNQNNFTFTFTGINFKDERRIQYSYKLDGVDDNWSSPSKEYAVTYSRIPSGQHTFRVKALSAEGIWSANEAVFSFTIEQPFYTTWWFVLLIVLLISAIIYTIYRYRINQLLAIHHIRQNISKDLHDDIGATVSSINILANIAKSDLISESKRNQFLQTIQDETKHVSQSISDIVWSINPKNDSLEVMFARMQRYASELFEAANIDYQFTFPNTKIDDSKLDIHKRQHLYLIFKEGVNNLVKYANSSTATIHFEIQNQYLKMTIADNGKGFDVHKNTEGNGILNMKKRAEEIKGTLELESQMGIGTKICLSLKM